ncbi:MAG: T9SS type A sorting domain-containing protein [Flavobacteriales bacterium]|nr:T9SS type A sorting domain-containing protein [Flavobacteriales bacterium]
MKKKIYVGGLIIAIGTVAAIGLLKPSQEQIYQPRTIQDEQPMSIHPMLEYLHAIRANQITGEIDPMDVANARQDIQQFRKFNKASFPLNWSAAGPDNVGGRTRAVIVDRNDNNILYAGGVMGGIFKSTNKGASWYPVDDKFESMAVSTICQTKNGDVFFGTGESFTGSGGQKVYTMGFSGNGIYRSTDNGKSFSRIASTSGLTYVNRLASHPTKNYVLAATSTGLYVSNESDPTQTWTQIRPGNAEDVTFDKNGNAFVYITNRVYRSTNPTDNSSYTQVTGLPLANSRMAIAASPSDPNYVYAVVVGTVSIDGTQGAFTVSGGLIGIFQSKDNGQNFSQIVGKASALFAPFTNQSLQSAQGNYDLALGVHPYNKERIFVGGVEFAEWTEAGGPIIVGNTFNSPFNPLGIHADKHWVTFDTVSKPAIMYVATDGGISKTTNADLNRYIDINNGYQTTAFYGIAAGVDGSVMGGTQDQGGLYVNGKGSTPQAGVRINGGDNYQCDVSKIDSRILFMQAYYGLMGRTLNAGGSFSSIWDPRIKEYFVDKTEPISRVNNIVNTPLKLWEDRDSMKSRLFFGMDNEMWMANGASTTAIPQWFRIANLGVDPYNVDFTPDGGTLYIAGFGGSRIFRLDGLNDVTWDTTMYPGNTIPSELKLTDIKSNLPSRTITSIEVDDNNKDRVIVTMGNYGNSSFVYITEDATSASPTWRSIQGNLPRFPVYDAEISTVDPDMIMLGTEYGIYACTNGTATTPTWVENNDQFPLVPAFDLYQVEAKKVDGANAWRTGPMLYAGTHGRGIFKSSNLLTSFRPVNPMDIIRLYIYPNPGSEFVKVQMPGTVKGDVKLTILSMSGQVVKSQDLRLSSSTIDLNVSDLNRGNYIVQVEGENFKGTSKFVKMN